MNLDISLLEAIRDCCRDDAAFERLQRILLTWQIDPRSHPSQSRYEAILNAIPDRMFRVNRQGDYLDFAGNQEDADLGVQPESVIGRNIRELLPPPVAQLCLEAIGLTLGTGESQTCEYQLPVPLDAEEIRDFEARLALCDRDEVLVIVQDITHRKRAEERVRQAEAEYRSIFEATSDGLLINDLDTGVVVAANPACCQMHGYTQAEFVGLHPTAFIHPDSYPLFEDYVARVKAGQRFQCRAMDLRRDGTAFHVEVRGTQLIYRGSPHLLASIRDVTEQVTAETRLRLTADRDRLLGQIALKIRRSLNLEQILTTTVAEVRQFLQADRVFIGQIDANFQGRILAESVAPEWGSILNWIWDDMHLRELRELLVQGQVRVFDDTNQLELPPLLAEYFPRCHIQASMGVPIFRGETLLAILIVHQCSHPRHWTELEVDLMRQLADQVAIALQQAELYQQVQSLNASLEQQVQERTAQLRQKMQELQTLSQRQDDFLHAVSHDLRTPVMGMLLVLKNMQNKAEDSIPLPRTVLDRMVQSCDRQVQMINSLLDTHAIDVKGITLHCQPMHLEQLVLAIASDLEPLLLENQATLVNQMTDTLPMVEIDPAQIQRVFENLLTNALKHNPPGLQIVLGATVLRASLQDSEISDPLSSLRCTVQDNGVGMTEEESQALFERYAQGSRARRSPGLGLGLYLCRQIVTAHGGEIGAISSPGKGATFWFTLPLA